MGMRNQISSPVCLLVVGISPSRVGGMEQLMKETCRQLRDRGWRMVIALENDPSPMLLGYFADLPEVRFVVAPHHGGLAPKQIPMFWRILQDARPQMVIYAFNGILRLLPWLAYLRRVKRIIYWEHSSKPIGYVPQAFPFAKRLVAWFLSWPLDGVTTVSQYTAKCLAMQGFYPAGRITAVHSGVPFDREEPSEGSTAFRREFGIPLEGKLVMQVSWIVADKGIDVLLRAFRRVLDARPGTLLAIVGVGPKKEECESLARQLGIAESVYFTGSVTTITMPEVFVGADVYCQMSQWEEALGLVVVEAQAVGRPVIATRVGGIPEMVVEGETGYLVGRLDEAAAAARMIELLDDTTLPEAHGRSGPPERAPKF